MRMRELLKRAFGYLLMSMGVSSPAKRPAERPLPPEKNP